MLGDILLAYNIRDTKDFTFVDVRGRSKYVFASDCERVNSYLSFMKISF